MYCVFQEKDKYKPNCVPLDGLTTFQRDYQGRPGDKTQSFKPEGRAVASDAPFEDSTTFKTDYRKWAAARPYQHQPDAYRKPDGEMDMNTTHKIAYQQHPLQRHAAIRPDGGRMEPGKFDDTTNYSTDYKPWKADRVHPTMKPDYVPNNAPFEGCSTQKSHYIQHPMAPTQSFKPNVGAINSGPFEDGTMYRQEYTKKESEPCPAAVLDTGRSKYRYIEQDPRGHKLYQPVFTSITPLRNGSAPPSRNGQVNGVMRTGSAGGIKPPSPQLQPLAVA